METLPSEVKDWSSLTTFYEQNQNLVLWQMSVCNMLKEPRQSRLFLALLLLRSWHVAKFIKSKWPECHFAARTNALNFVEIY